LIDGEFCDENNIHKRNEDNAYLNETILVIMRAFSECLLENDEKFI
jgi:hypothetical protein